MLTIGIDPGQTGAVSFKRGGSVYCVEDMPTSARQNGTGETINSAALAAIIKSHLKEDKVLVILEQVGAMPGQGVSSMFKFGEGFGIVQGVIGTLGLPLKFSRPQSWKKKAGLSGKDKDVARTMAIQMCPLLAASLTRKKDIGRADAILINVFGE